MRTSAPSTTNAESRTPPSQWWRPNLRRTCLLTGLSPAVLFSSHPLVASRVEKLAKPKHMVFVPVIVIPECYSQIEPTLAAFIEDQVVRGGKPIQRDTKWNTRSEG